MILAKIAAQIRAARDDTSVSLNAQRGVRSFRGNNLARVEQVPLFATVARSCFAVRSVLL